MSKEFGGGELLRALLESQAIDSMPFFYMVPMTGATGSAAALTVQQATIQTENDSCFLMTSFWGISSNIFGGPEFLGIFDGAQQNAFVNAVSNYFTSGAPFTWSNPNSVYAGLINDSLASCVTLPEYVLWGPNSLISVSWLGANTQTFTAYRYLVLGGIKYHLKGN